MSERLKLNKEDGSKMFKGLLIALGGAAVAYVAELIPSVDFGAYTPIAVALGGVLVNTARKFLAKQ